MNYNNKDNTPSVACAKVFVIIEKYSLYIGEGGVYRRHWPTTNVDISPLVISVILNILYDQMSVILKKKLPLE